VSFDNENYKIEFPRSLLEDFEIALDKYKDSDCFRSLESAIKFKIYIKLGNEGLLRDTLISKELINEKREWLKDYRVNTVFDKENTEVFYKGLKNIISFFDSLLEKYKSLNLSEIEEDKKWIQNLIDYYEENKNLNSTGTGVRNLEYLKGAAIEQILTFENLKKTEQKPSVLRAIDKKTYSIVAQLRKDPFLQIRPPKFIHDLEVERRGNR